MSRDFEGEIKNLDEGTTQVPTQEQNLEHPTAAPRVGCQGCVIKAYDAINSQGTRDIRELHVRCAGGTRSRLYSRSRVEYVRRLEKKRPF